MSFRAGWQRRGQEVLQEKQELRAQQNMKILEHQAAQQAQAQDISILERLSARGRPVMGDGTIMEDKTLPADFGAGMGALSSQAGQTVQIARPADRSRIARYKDSTGQDHAFELLSEKEQIQRQIEAKVAETKAVGGAQTAVGLDRMTQQAGVEDKIDASRAIAMPAAFAAAMPGQEKLPPSQFNLAAHLTTAKNQTDHVANELAINKANNARMIAIQNSKNVAQWEKFKGEESGRDKRFRVAESGRYERARMTAAKQAGLSDKEAAKLTSEARKLYDEGVEVHQLRNKIGMMRKAGIYADAKGNPVYVQGQPITVDSNNAAHMEAVLADLEARAKALEQQRLRLEADMGGSPLYQGPIVNSSPNQLRDDFSGKTMFGKK